MNKIIAIMLLVLAVYFALISSWIAQQFRAIPKPDIVTNRYWGRGPPNNYKPNNTIEPFVVNYSQEIIDDLRTELNRTWRFTEPLEGTKFLYGFNSNSLKEVVRFWRDDYLPRWQQRQAYINSMPHFTTEIQGLRIHYMHIKPNKATLQKTTKVIPLLLLHGWPATVLEFYNFIHICTEQRNKEGFTYEIIAPSLVGYGWSEPAYKSGLDAAQMAIVMRNLMLRLGFNKFLIQGGDWGAVTGAALTTLFPENVIGYHSTMCLVMTPLSLIKYIFASFFPNLFLPNRAFYEHHFPLIAKLQFLYTESGYFHLQATRPETLGAALIHNPIGLAAYLLEKYLLTTGPERNQKFESLHEAYTMDALLDNIMVYYLTSTSTSAARFYAESLRKEFWNLQLDRVQTPVPMGCARFKHDLPPALDWQLKDKYTNLVHSEYFNQGGHFMALEMPNLLYLDFSKFVQKLNINEI